MKLLICDDDISTVDVIQNHIDFQTIRINKLFRAYNGEVAKQILKDEKPELVLCDIDMPRCSGIEVLKYLREELKNDKTQFAFITCYQSFDYAKEAIKYGATEYLTKPLNLEEVQEALIRMVEINEQREGRSLGQNVADANLNNLFRMVSSRDVRQDPKQISLLLEAEQQEFTYDSLWTELYIIGEITEPMRAEWSPEGLSFCFSRLAEELFCEYIGSAYSIARISDRYIFCRVYIPEGRFTAEDYRNKWAQFLEIAVPQFSICPVGLIHTGLVFYRLGEGLGQRTALITKLRFREKQLIFADELKSLAEPRKSLVTLSEEKLLRFLNARSQAEFTGEVKDYLAALKADATLSEESMKETYERLRKVGRIFLSNNGIADERADYFRYVDEIGQRAQRSQADMLIYANELFRYAVFFLDESEAEKNTVEIVKKYLSEHFREEVDREELANRVFITPNYLSKKFCQETGMNIREYINRLRIEEAKKILLATNKSISEIALEVGYDNISYFSTVFKRIVMKTPLAWRQGENS